MTIERLAPTGEGVARLPTGRVVLVPRTLPLERVEIAVSKRRGKLIQVLSPSPARVEPCCVVADRCGGCDHMHIDPEVQPRLHAEVVGAVVGHALGSAVPVPEVTIHRPQPALGYRTRARLQVRAKSGRPAQVGLRASRSHRLVDAIEAGCAVLHPTLLAAAETLRRHLAGDGEGEALIALGREGLPVVVLRWSGELSAKSSAALTGAVDPEGRFAPGSWAGVQLELKGAREPLVAGDPRSRQLAGDGEELVFPAGGFSQPSASGGNALAARVAELVARKRCLLLVELYAGSGTLSVAIGPLAERFIAVEQSPSAAACLRDNLAARRIAAKIRELDSGALSWAPSVSTVVLDPPRGGALEVMKSLVSRRKGLPRTMIYVSCEPTTLARDLAVLCHAGYELSELSTLELFPQTSRVETVAWMVRR